MGYIRMGHIRMGYIRPPACSIRRGEQVLNAMYEAAEGILEQAVIEGFV